jgi:hypothetical protein
MEEHGGDNSLEQDDINLGFYPRIAFGNPTYY